MLSVFCLKTRNKWLAELCAHANGHWYRGVMENQCVCVALMRRSA